MAAMGRGRGTFPRPRFIANTVGFPRFFVMEWLNYHHLLYFYVVAREGSVAKASDVLGLAQPTVSGQIHALEREVGQKLFARSGRSLVLTDTGKMAYRYAEEIFSLGRELSDSFRGRAAGNVTRLAVGVADVIPKLVVHRLVHPVLRSGERRIVIRDGKPDVLVADLAIHALDLVITDAPVAPSIRVRTYNHQLHEGPVTVFGAPKLHAKLARGFPDSLNGAPFLVPTDSAQLRRSIDQWFADRNWRPEIVGEFDDSAVLKTFGMEGEGLFVAPTMVAEQVKAQYRVKALGVLDGVKERLYAITLDRKVRNPATLAIIGAAKQLVW